MSVNTKNGAKENGDVKMMNSIDGGAKLVPFYVSQICGNQVIYMQKNEIFSWKSLISNNYFYFPLFFSLVTIPFGFGIANGVVWEFRYISLIASFIGSVF